MIAKHVPTPMGGSGYQRLSAYVLDVRREHRESTDPASWTRLSSYVLDTTQPSDKVAWARTTNCGHEDPGWAVRHILAVQARNTRSRSDKSYHLVVSFLEGERPSREQMEDIEDQLCDAIGYCDHQRVSALHQNTDNWHLHVAINKVHPTSLRNVTPIRDHFRLQAACAELEIKHGLTQERHTAEPVQQSEVKVRGRAADFEARSGEPSFLAWLQTHARADLLAAANAGQGWQAVHLAGARYDLDLRLRGAGLIIVQRGDAGLRVKASYVDRGLSLGAMTKRFGPFEPAGVQEPDDTPGPRYERPAPSAALYQQFRQQREASARARDAALRDLTVRHRADGGKLVDWYRERLRQERARRQTTTLRRDSVRHITAQRNKDRKVRAERERAERRHVRMAHPIPNWQGFLESQAADGDEHALAVLRARQRRAQQLETDILTAENTEQARHVVHRHLRPTVRRDGRMIYYVSDGGMVSDEAENVRVPQLTTAAAFLALSLAADRFGGRPLVAKGSDDFRSALSAVAALKGMTVTFADASFERQRANHRTRSSLNRGQDADLGR